MFEMAWRDVVPVPGRHFQLANDPPYSNLGHLGRLNESILQAARFRRSRGRLNLPAVLGKPFQVATGQVIAFGRLNVAACVSVAGPTIAL